MNTEKRHVKHLGSNMTAESIVKMSISLAGISNVGTQLNTICNVVQRRSSNKRTSAVSDELQMIEGLRTIERFRLYQAAKKLAIKLPLESLLKQLAGSRFHARLWKRGNVLLHKLDI